MKTWMKAGTFLAAAFCMGKVLAAQEESEATTILQRVEALLNSEVNPELEAKKLLADAVSERLDFLDLSYVEPDGKGGSSGWAAKYNLAYGTNGGDGFSTSSGRATLRTFAFDFDLSGTYAFHDAVNPEDLSKATLSLSYLRGDFGAIEVANPPDTAAYLNCVAAQPEDPPQEEDFDSSADFDAAIDDYLEWQQQCWAEHEIDRLAARDSVAFAYSIDLHAQLEGDQKFADTNTVYGAEFLVSAGSFPSLRLLLENVDASENEQRKALTSDEEFDRVSAEVGYHYTFRNLASAPVTLYLNYRYFHELSAPAAIAAADLDSFDYFAATLSMPAYAFGLTDTDDFNLFLRYTDGQLPFDLVEDEAIEFGFSTNIGFLSDLLAK